MDIFGLGPLNILLILGVMLIVFGPERLPEMAAKAGKFVRDLRSYASDVTGEFSGEISELREHFDGVHEQVRAFGADVQSTTGEVGATFRDLASSVSESPAVASMNEPPPAAEPSDKVVPLTATPLRPRVEDYKPGG